jgi:methionine biosynthesis protein MetW
MKASDHLIPVVPASVDHRKDYYEGYWSARGYRPEGAIFPELRDLLQANVPVAARTLDIGCGDGRTCGLWLKNNTSEYVGVDISETAVNQARAIGLDARLIDDATELPFSNNRFDVAVCVEVLEHVFLPNLVATEVLRVLRPGGLLIVTVPNCAYWRRRAELAVGRWNPFGDGLSTTEPWRDPHIRFFTRISLKNMLLTSGFAAVRVGGHYGTFVRDLPYLGRIFRSPRRATKIYRLLQRVHPSLFGLRLHATALKDERAFAQ